MISSIASLIALCFKDNNISDKLEKLYGFEKIRPECLLQLVAFEIFSYLCLIY